MKSWIDENKLKKGFPVIWPTSFVYRRQKWNRIQDFGNLTQIIVD